MLRCLTAGSCTILDVFRLKSYWGQLFFSSTYLLLTQPAAACITGLRQSATETDNLMHRRGNASQFLFSFIYLIHSFISCTFASGPLSAHSLSRWAAFRDANLNCFTFTDRARQSLIKMKWRFESTLQSEWNTLWGEYTSAWQRCVDERLCPSFQSVCSMIHVFVEMSDKYFFWKVMPLKLSVLAKQKLFSVDYANLFRSGQIAYWLLITAVKSISAASSHCFRYWLTIVEPL